MIMCFVVFFFFKQKTAYEMRISDWSSDVCSSDLAFGEARQYPVLRRFPIVDSRMGIGRGRDLVGDRGLADEVEAPHIGRGLRDRLVVPREVVDEHRDRGPILLDQAAHRHALAAAAADHGRGPAVSHTGSAGWRGSGCLAGLISVWGV